MGKIGGNGTSYGIPEEMNRYIYINKMRLIFCHREREREMFTNLKTS